MATTNEITTAQAQGIEQTVTTADVVAAFLAELDASDKTRDTYRKALRQYAAWLEAAHVALNQTTRAHVVAYKKHLQDTKAASTTNAYLTAVRSLYAWLNGRTGYPNVAQGVRGVRTSSQSSKDALTVAQARDLITAPAEGEQGLRDHAMLTLMIRRGLRTIEVSRANVEDIRATAQYTLSKMQSVKCHDVMKPSMDL
jgi:integrase/recombinase XerC